MIEKKLQFLVLKHLAVQPRSGYGLSKDIEQATGWKPSYGSMYPLLDELNTKKLVQFKIDGRKKVYSLTVEGKKAVQHLDEQQETLIEQLRENMNLVAHMCGFESKQHEELMELFFSAMKKGDVPFKEIMDESTRLKIILWKLYEQGTLAKEKKKINAMISSMADELEKMVKE